MEKVTNRFMLLFLCMSLNCQNSFSQSSWKGLYIDQFHTILGNQSKEDSLFNYLSANQFNKVTLYNLHLLDFSNNLQMNKLRSFISSLRLNHGILDVGAAAENFWFFENKIAPYNSSSQMNERFTTFNLEFEFWVPSSVSGYYCDTYLSPNGFSCTEDGAFQFYFQELSQIKSLAVQQNCIAEVYLGWFNQQQADSLKLKADRIVLSAYQNNPSNSYAVSTNRLSYLGNTNPSIEVLALFSSETAFLNTWLTANQNNLDSVYDMYNNAFNSEISSWKNQIELNGHQWFTYTTMNYDLPELNSISLIEDTKFVQPMTKDELITWLEMHNFEVFNLLGQKMYMHESTPTGLYLVKKNEILMKIRVL